MQMDRYNWGYRFLILQLWVSCLWLAGCADENLPDNFEPEVMLNEATEITRTSALLTGRVIVPSGSRTDLFHFLYGTSTDLEQTSPSSLGDEGEVKMRLEGLTPGTTYFYRLDAGNVSYRVQSEVRSFTTLPNKVPTLQPIVVLGQGPVSIILRCDIVDDGGEGVTARGFRYESAGGDVHEEEVALDDETQWRLRIDGLERNTDYTIRAFADNRVGRAYSETYSFRTGDAVVLTEAGMLPEIIGDGKYEHTRLNIVGMLNGTDWRLLRDMGGRGVDGKETPGRLASLDLTDAAIVEGGLSYDESRYTKNDVVSYGMFANLTGLYELALPAGIKSIEQDAFMNCSSLVSLQIPAGVTMLTPSAGCSKLTSVSVAEGNSSYMSLEGIVYTKNGESLIWFPEGFDQEEVRLSPTLKSLGEYALQKCRASKIVLPASLTDIGQQAFRESEFETIVIPDGVVSVPYALFQRCSKLTTVVLGSGCEWLSNYCFDGCPLQSLYVNAPIPPVCSPDTFTGAESLFNGCTLYVPSGSKALYRNHPVWKQFVYIKEAVYDKE